MPIPTPPAPEGKEEEGILKEYHSDLSNVEAPS